MWPSRQDSNLQPQPSEGYALSIGLREEIGAGRGNRTPILSLEGWCLTTRPAPLGCGFPSAKQYAEFRA